MPKSTDVQPAARSRPEHVRVAHARLQVAGEGDVRERRAGPAAAPEQLLADRRHVALVRVEGGVDHELLGRAEVPAQPLHLVGDGLGGRRRRRAPSRPRVGAVDAAVRAAARRLHAGGAVAARRRGTPRPGRRGGRRRARSSSGSSTMPSGSRPSAIRRAAASPSPTTPSRDEQRAADLAREDGEGRAAEDDPRLRRGRAHRVGEARVPVRVGARVRPGGVVGVAQREPDDVRAPVLQLGPQRREGPPVEARVEDAGPAAGGLHRRGDVQRPYGERRLGELLAVGDDDEDALHRPSMDYLGRRCVGRAPAPRRRAGPGSPSATGAGASASACRGASCRPCARGAGRWPAAPRGAARGRGSARGRTATAAGRPRRWSR